jgi:hypothetical protein
MAEIKDETIRHHINMAIPVDSCATKEKANTTNRIWLFQKIKGYLAETKQHYEQSVKS